MTIVSAGGPWRISEMYFFYRGLGKRKCLGWDIHYRSAMLVLVYYVMLGSVSKISSVSIVTIVSSISFESKVLIVGTKWKRSQ